MLAPLAQMLALNDMSYRNPQSSLHIIQYITIHEFTAASVYRKCFFYYYVTLFLLSARRPQREAQGDGPSRADDLSGVTPFTLTDSESAYRSE